MRENKSDKVTFIIILAAIVAALTTVAVLLFRARARRKAMCVPTAFDYEFDDCDCYDDACDCGCCGEADETDDSAAEETPAE